MNKTPRRIKKIGHFRLPREWQPLETRTLGPFIVEVVHRLQDGTVRSWNSRAYRKGFVPRVRAAREEMRKRRKGDTRTPRLFFLSPKELNWWISVLFMIGALLFAAGSVIVMRHPDLAANANVVFFTGSIFFTSAAYIQYFQAINAQVLAHGLAGDPGGKRAFAWKPRRIDFWVTATQFAGTILFNFNTGDAFWTRTPFQENLFVWWPNITGSILFMVSGTLAMLEICRGWCWRPRDIEWNITFVNFLGCVAFLISAVLAHAPATPVFENQGVWSTMLTLIGAACFFTGAYLMLPEMSVRTATPAREA
jgi:hypothetical protein